MTKHNATEHDFLGQLLRLGLHHQHCGLGARDHEVHLRDLQL